MEIKRGSSGLRGEQYAPAAVFTEEAARFHEEDAESEVDENDGYHDVDYFGLGGTVDGRVRAAAVHAMMEDVAVLW